VTVHDHDPSLFEAGAGGTQLRQDIGAIAMFFEHLAEAADLSLDAREAVEEPFLGADLICADR
jgi:hypothetical protein